MCELKKHKVVPSCLHTHTIDNGMILQLTILLNSYYFCTQSDDVNLMAMTMRRNILSDL